MNACTKRPRHDAREREDNLEQTLENLYFLYK